MSFSFIFNFCDSFVDFAADAVAEEAVDGRNVDADGWCRSGQHNVVEQRRRRQRR